MRAASDELTTLVINGRCRNFQAIDCASVEALPERSNCVGADTARRREGVLVPIQTTFCLEIAYTHEWISRRPRL